MNYDVNGLSQNQKIKITEGIKKYLQIQACYNSCKNLTDLNDKNCVDFQKKFGGFYKAFLEALVEGGIELFDEVHEVFECAVIDLIDADFTRLRW